MFHRLFDRVWVRVGLLPLSAAILIAAACNPQVESEGDSEGIPATPDSRAPGAARGGVGSPPGGAPWVASQDDSTEETAAAEIPEVVETTEAAVEEATEALSSVAEAVEEGVEVAEQAQLPVVEGAAVQVLEVEGEPLEWMATGAEGGPGISQGLPGSGGTLPDRFVGTYRTPRAFSPDHSVTVTPFGMSSTLCQSIDCMDGSINFAAVDCPSDNACVFTSPQCTGSIVQQPDGQLLVTSALNVELGSNELLGLCRGFAGTLQPLAESGRLDTPADCEALASLLSEAETRQVPPTDGAFARGPESAPVTIVEFSDFECPYCSRARTTLDRLLEQYGQQVRLVFRHFPLEFHTNAEMAAQAALAAGEQGRFWEMHDLIFDNQSRLSRNDLLEYAGRLGLDLNAFRQYVDSAAGQPRIEADLELGRRVGVRGTPTFLINGRTVNGAQPIERFQELVDEELLLAENAAAAGIGDADFYACLREVAGD
jgi:protein-disulfide isomerase